jgi:hypothetical protein
MFDAPPPRTEFRLHAEVFGQGAKSLDAHIHSVSVAAVNC